ncbi:MAG TPA: helix-turn-helix transcriptional regulator [Egibacteraceae bacterium]|nr:helix-turn-helix transcriptional regulator [Actinomycetota bacterium]HWB72395.1 helix-turn-helix transcriptional regulator [Egibacteraceae bacterium]
MRDVAERAQQEVVRLAHQGLDLFTFLECAQEQFRRVTAFEGAACFFTIDPATHLLTGHINDDLAHDDERRRAVNLGVANNEYNEEDYNKFAELARSAGKAGVLADATGGRPEHSARYRELIRPFGLDGELRAAFVADDACWGSVALFRTPDQPSFEEGDRDFFHRISRDMAEGMRTALVLRAIDGVDGPDSPGLILLDDDGMVEAVNPMASHWLGQLVDPGQPTGEVLPEVVYAVAERARRAAAGDPDHGPVHARVPSRAGRWLILHGTRLQGRRRGAAVIIEPARAPDITPLLLEAYGLSGREQAVTLCVLQGLSTAEIAERLFISPYTVQDHLKEVFEKVGVRSRKALVARIFFEQYFSRMQDPPG